MLWKSFQKVFKWNSHPAGLPCCEWRKEVGDPTQCLRISLAVACWRCLSTIPKLELALYADPADWLQAFCPSVQRPVNPNLMKPTGPPCREQRRKAACKAFFALARLRRVQVEASYHTIERQAWRYCHTLVIVRLPGSVVTVENASDNARVPTSWRPPLCRMLCPRTSGDTHSTLLSFSWRSDHLPLCL